MRRRLRTIEARVLPRGWNDVVRQFLLFVAAYMLYKLVRGLVDGGNPYRPFGDATKIIDLERRCISSSSRASRLGPRTSTVLMDIADWTYLNAPLLRHRRGAGVHLPPPQHSFYFVRNMFMIAMAIGLVGYWLYPAAPPRLMPEWGFTDSISRFL